MGRQQLHGQAAGQDKIDRQIDRYRWLGVLTRATTRAPHGSEVLIIPHRHYLYICLQASYLPDGHAACGTGNGAEGVFGGPKSGIPWCVSPTLCAMHTQYIPSHVYPAATPPLRGRSIKWSRGLCNTLHAEGFWGGHVGPFFHREKFGFDFWDVGQHAILRGKWTGNSMPNLYPDL